VIFIIAGFFAFLFRPLPVNSYMLRRVLLRFLLRNFGRSLKVAIRHTPVVLLCDHRAVPHPVGSDVSRMLGGQFSRPSTSQVLEEFGPWRQLGLVDDAV
jgi:hypothetical protein